MEHVQERPEQRVRPPWHPWEALPVGIAATAATFLAAIGVTAAFGGQGGSATLVIAMISQASLFGFSVAWVAIRYPGALAALGIRSRRLAADLAVGAWVGAALFGAVVFLVYPIVALVWRLITGSPPGAIDQQILPFDPTPVQLVLGTVAVVIAAPVGEEVFFRGFLFGSLRARLGFSRAAAISAAVFGLFHIDPVLIVLMFFVGLGLATLYHRRGSLVAPMAAHAMFNIVGYTLLVMERA